MAVTVKTIKKKPLALKKGGGKAEPAAEPVLDADGNPVEGAAPAAAAPAAAAPAAPAKPVKEASYTFAGVCAILSFLMFGAILTLQILEWKFYLAPPKSAFPPFGTLLPIPGGSSVSTAPVVGDGEEDFLAGEEDADDLDAGADAPEEGGDDVVDDGEDSLD